MRCSWSWWTSSGSRCWRRIHPRIRSHLLRAAGARRTTDRAEAEASAEFPGLEAPGAGEPVGHGRLRQIIAYARKVYGLCGLLGRVEDSRRKPGTSAPLVAAAVLFTGLLRIRSFNALEPKLREKSFLRIVGAQGERRRLCSVDTLSRALRVTDLESARAVSVAILRKA